VNSPLPGLMMRARSSILSTGIALLPDFRAEANGKFVNLESQIVNRKPVLRLAIYD
jgi:hypothetical protein